MLCVRVAHTSRTAMTGPWKAQLVPLSGVIQQLEKCKIHVKHGYTYPEHMPLKLNHVAIYLILEHPILTLITPHRFSVRKGDLLVFRAIVAESQA